MIWQLLIATLLYLIWMAYSASINWLRSHRDHLELSLYENLRRNNLFFKYARNFASFMFLVVAQPNNTMVVRQLVGNMDEDFMYRVFSPGLQSALSNGRLNHIDVENIYFSSLGSRKTRKMYAMRQYGTLLLTFAVLLTTIDSEEYALLHSVSSVLSFLLCYRSRRSVRVVSCFVLTPMQFRNTLLQLDI